MKDDYWPVWFRISLSAVCFLGGVYMLAVDRPFFAGFLFVAAVVGLVGAWHSRRQRSGSAHVGRAAGQQVDLTRKVAAILVAAFGALAIGAIVFLVNADGNITAYVVGGAILVMALYVVLAAITGEKKSPSP